MQVGPHGRLRPALAGAGEEARLRAAVALLRATRKSRLSDVVRPAKRLRRGIPEVPRRSRREVGPPGAGEGAVGAVGAQRRRALGRRHGDAAPGPHRRGLAAVGRAAPERRSHAQGNQGAHTAGRGAQGAADVQPRHEGRRDRQGQELRRRVARQRGVLQRGARQGRARRRGRRSAVESRLRQPALPRDPVARCVPDRAAAEDRGRSARRHADGQGVARAAHRQRSGPGREVHRRTAQGRVAAERGDGEGVDGVRQGHEGVGHHPAARADRTCACRATS